MAKVKEMTANELEALVYRLDLQKQRLDQNITEMKSDRGRIATELAQARQALAQRQQAAASPRVSPHAVLRFLERVAHIDVRAVERLILSPENIMAIEAGASRITVDGVGLVVKEKVVVTVLAD